MSDLPIYSDEHGWFAEFWASEEVQKAYANTSIMTDGDIERLSDE